LAESNSSCAIAALKPGEESALIARLIGAWEE